MDFAPSLIGLYPICFVPWATVQMIPRRGVDTTWWAWGRYYVTQLRFHKLICSESQSEDKSTLSQVCMEPKSIRRLDPQ
jgi:hypothetical protein